VVATQPPQGPLLERSGHEIFLIKEIKYSIGRRDKPLKVAVIVDLDGSHGLCLRSIPIRVSVAL
jgi:hypothetical protein